MLPAATWVTAAALVTPVAFALVSSPVVAEPGPATSSSASPEITESSSPIISESPSTPAPDPSTTAPTAPPVNPLTPELQMEMDLDALGLPTGKVDGYVNASTRRALCAYRDLNGLGATRGQPGTALMSKISSSSDLPLLPRKLFGVKALVSLTCQTAYIT